MRRATSSFLFSPSILRQTSAFAPSIRTYAHITMEDSKNMKATTVLSVRRNKQIVMIADGQVSAGGTIFDPHAVKVRRLKGDVIVGFAGSTIGAITLLEKMEAKIEEHPGQLLRSCVAMAREFARGKERTVDAVMLVSDKKETFYVSGNGDVHECPKHGVIAIGSGGNYAASAALALLETDWDAKRIATKAMNIAAELCLYTNKNFTIEELDEDSTPTTDEESQTKAIC